MSYVRSDGYQLKDPGDDAALQVVIGDLKRLALAMYKGTGSAAYQLTLEAATANGTPPSTDINSTVATMLGAPVRISVLTSGTSIALLSQTKAFTALLVGGGGAGGGGPGNASFNFPAAGGGGGACINALFKVSEATLSYTVGSGGTGVSGSAGNDGTATTLNYRGATLTAGGGRGGYANGSGIADQNGGLPNITTALAACLIIAMNPGGHGHYGGISSYVTASGAISTSFTGPGGSGWIGVDGLYYGGGGTGRLNNGAIAGTGADGYAGLLLITELA